MVAVLDALPKVAVTVAEVGMLTATVLILNVIELAFTGTNAVAGTLTAALFEEMVTLSPVAPAGPPRLTAP